MSTRILAGVIAMIPLFYSVLEADEYEIGGPLAGLKLPLFKTQHGEKPGYPGNLPGQYDHDPLAPELELYPGSVEQYHREGCVYLTKSATPIKKSDALKRGYTPCKRCVPWLEQCYRDSLLDLFQ